MEDGGKIGMVRGVREEGEREKWKERDEGEREEGRERQEG